MSPPPTKTSDRFLMVESKMRSSPASTKYSRITPVGSSSALAGETIRWRFPSQAPGRYFDPSQSFISYTVTNPVATSGMGVSGCGGFYRTSLLRCAGQHLSSIENYPLWRNLYTKQHVPIDFLKNDGAVMMGTADASKGESLLITSPARSFVDFLSNFAPLFQLDNMISLGTNSPLEWDLTIGGAADNYMYATDVLGNAHVALGEAGFKLTELVLHLAITDVPVQIERDIVSLVGGEFREITNNTIYNPFFAASGGQSFVFQLGLSCSSLNKIDVCMTETGTISQIPFNVFVKKNLVSARLLIDGIPILPHGINAKSNAIALAMNRVADHSLADFGSFQVGTPTQFNDTGFWLSFDTDSITRKGNELRSGLNVSSATVVLELNFDAATAENLNVHCISHFDSLVSCDYSGSKDWEISI